MLKVADYNILQINRFTDVGVYLEDGGEGLLLPRRFVPENVKVGDNIEVFVYHDGEERLIATTQKPFVKVNEIGYLKAVSTTSYGAFLDWGLMKDIFVPKSKQKNAMLKGEYYFVKIYIDEQTGRVAATEKIDTLIQNENVTVAELEQVHIRIYRESDLGYVCIINHQYEGLIHFSDVFQKLYIGDVHEGYVKKIYPETNKLDIMLGKPGYQKVENEVSKILRLLEEHNGYLPYNDKTPPEDIYGFFGMSKKVFKMTTGNLYKQKKIEFTQTGIKLLEE